MPSLDIESPEDAKKPLKLNKMVEENYIEGSWGKSDKPFNLFSPSMVGYCRRQMYNGKMGLTEPDRKIKGILNDGTRHHFWLEHNLPEIVEDRALETEKRVKTKLKLGHKDFDLFVSGYADAVDSEGYVYDHKFTSNTYYQQDSPKEKDRRQVLMYLFALDGVHMGQLEYVQADRELRSSDQVYHRITWDKEEFKRVVSRMADVAEAVKNREGTEKEVVNPFDKCDCHYCESEEFKPEVVEELSERGDLG